LSTECFTSWYLEFTVTLLCQPLPPQEEKELKETLQDIIGHGKTVEVEQKVSIITQIS
jgi:hypothetical protein